MAIGRGKPAPTLNCVVAVTILEKAGFLPFGQLLVDETVT